MAVIVVMRGAEYPFHKGRMMLRHSLSWFLINGEDFSLRLYTDRYI
jgi:hypothetical protein